MFERLRHEFDKGRCLSNLRLENGIVKCHVCEDIAGIEMNGEFRVFHKYDKHEKAVQDFWLKSRTKSNSKDPDWEEVKQEISEIRLPEDPTYIPHPVIDGEESPFTDGFDCEDSAAGDFYLGDDLGSKEQVDE